MLELSVALVIIACIAGFLVNKYLDQKMQVSNKAADAAISAAVEEGLKTFDGRINATWSTISDVKQELNALKMQIGLKGLK